MNKSLIYLALLLCVTFELSVAENIYKQDYGCADIIPPKNAYPDFIRSTAPDDAIMGNVHIVIASDKDIKIKAVKELFARNSRFNEAAKTYWPIKTYSNIANQPIGLTNGRLGALNRINNVVENFNSTHTFNESDLVYVCAIENYFESENLYAPRDHAFVMIRDPKGQLFEAVSVGVAIHRDVYEAATKDSEHSDTGYSKTVGEFLNEKYNFDSGDWFKDVTDIGLDRINQILTTCNDSHWF